jgi:hypothetical protein
MPRFVNPGADDSFRERMHQVVEERKIYAAGHCASVLQSPLSRPETKKKMFDRATASAARNGLAKHPFFGKGRDPARRFRRWLATHWGGTNGIREGALAKVEGINVEYGTGIPGIRRAGVRGAAATASWLRRRTEEAKELHNRQAENANTLLGVEEGQYQLKLLPP